jgi:hypothetical protein
MKIFASFHQSWNAVYWYTWDVGATGNDYALRYIVRTPNGTKREDY